MGITWGTDYETDRRRQRLEKMQRGFNWTALLSWWSAIACGMAIWRALWLHRGGIWALVVAMVPWTLIIGFVTPYAISAGAWIASLWHSEGLVG
jgi:hypothetical protein